MRWRITLLVAATTSLVLLAFLVPAGYLVGRVAHNNAVSRGQVQVQSLIPVLALSPRSGTEVAVASVSEAGYLVWVTQTNASTIGTDPAQGRLDKTGVSRAETVAVEPTAGAPGGVLIAQPVARSDGSAVIRLLVTDDELRSGVARIWLLLGGIGLILFLLSIFVADRFARAMARPITALAGTADLLSSGDLSARVTPDGPPEVVGVGVALNQLGERIGELLAAERESVADLSHRLRTPVTALRLDVDAVRGSAERERLSADVNALDAAIDEIIRSARRAADPDQVRCDAVAVVRDRLVFWTVLATHQNRAIETDICAPPVLVRSAASDLSAALDALVGNVFAHTPEGCGFEVRCAPEPAGGVEISVVDEGAGLGPDAVVRGDSGGGSTGLGLDIARQTAENSGGRLQIGRTAAGRNVVSMSLGPA